jgi:hypothetical protein
MDEQYEISEYTTASHLNDALGCTNALVKEHVGRELARRIHEGTLAVGTGSQVSIGVSHMIPETAEKSLLWG